MDITPSTRPSDLIGCPNCDQLYRVQPVADGMRATCSRCHTVLIAPKAAAFSRVLALSLANLVLVISAVYYPFLEISAAGLANRVSLLDVATSFGSGLLIAVSVASVAMIVLVPLLRTLLVAYVVAPLASARAPFRHAKAAFRLAEDMKPWAMTEIFVIGCAVALVKVAGLASLNFGVAFWMFIALSILVLFVDRSLCFWTIWTALDEQDSAETTRTEARA